MTVQKPKLLGKTEDEVKLYQWLEGFIDAQLENSIKKNPYSPEHMVFIPRSNSHNVSGWHINSIIALYEPFDWQVTWIANMEAQAPGYYMLFK